MTSKFAAVLTAVTLSVLAMGASAQPVAPKPSDEGDHGAHHPTEASPAPTPAPAAPGMMGDMGRMGSMMGGGMMPGMGRMMSGSLGLPFEHVEGRIAFLRTELKITDAQAPQWTAFADTLRTQAARMRAEHERLAAGGGAPMAGMAMGVTGSMPSGGMPATRPAQAWPDRLARQQAMLSTRMEVLRELEAAARPLYAVLSEEQRALADRLLSGPMGMM